MASPPIQTTPGRILIVDDNSMGLLARRSVLEELGHHVATSSTGQEALDLCGKQRFDIIITDYKMPKMNGIELIGKLRKLDSNYSIILISGFVDALGLNEANTGADIVLQKSANEVSYLIRSVNRLMRKPPLKKKPSSQSATKADKRKSV